MNDDSTIRKVDGTTSLSKNIPTSTSTSRTAIDSMQDTYVNNTLVLEISKLYLHSLQRPPPVTTIGLHNFWTSLSYDDLQQLQQLQQIHQQHQQQSQNRITGSTTNTASSSISSSSSVDKIYNAYRTCYQYKPETINKKEKKQQQLQQQQQQPTRNITSMDIVSNKPTITFPGNSSKNTGTYIKLHEQNNNTNTIQQQQQQQKQYQPLTNEDTTEAIVAVNNDTHYSTNNTQQQQQQQQKAYELLKQTERKNVCNDCLSHITCTEQSKKYRSCWKQTMYQLTQQQMKHYQNVQQQQQQQNNTDESSFTTNKQQNQQQQQQMMITQSIQFWKQLKEEGYLNSICIHERENVERCIGTTIQNANYERQV